MLVGQVVITPYTGCSAKVTPLFSILESSSWSEASTRPRSLPCTMEIMRSWSSSPTQIILVLSLLSQMPRPYGQSEATPEEVRWLSVVMSLKRQWSARILSASSLLTKFLWPGVRLQQRPGMPKLLNTFSMVSSKRMRSSLLMLGGRFQPFTLRATLARMETLLRLGSMLVSRYLPTGMSQLCSCFVLPWMPWYSRINGSRQKAKASQSSGRVAYAPTEESSLHSPPIITFSSRCWSSWLSVLALAFTSFVKYLLARLVLTFLSSAHLASTLSQSTLPSPFRYSFLASSRNTNFSDITKDIIINANILIKVEDLNSISFNYNFTGNYNTIYVNLFLYFNKFNI